MEVIVAHVRQHAAVEAMWAMYGLSCLRRLRIYGTSDGVCTLYTIHSVDNTSPHYTGYSSQAATGL